MCVAKCKGMGNESTCDVSVVVCGCSGCGVDSAVCKGCGALGVVEWSVVCECNECEQCKDRE